jgi:phosphate/sulfate permease
MVTLYALAIIMAGHNIKLITHIIRIMVHCAIAMIVGFLFYSNKLAKAMLESILQRVFFVFDVI